MEKRSKTGFTLFKICLCNTYPPEAGIAHWEFLGANETYKYVCVMLKLTNLCVCLGSLNVASFRQCFVHSLDLHSYTFKLWIKSEF